jgi:preprotein translocase subunit SecF
LKESRAMDRLELILWGMSVNAQGTTAIIAAFLIVVLLVSLRFRK